MQNTNLNTNAKCKIQNANISYQGNVWGVQNEETETAWSRQRV